MPEAAAHQPVPARHVEPGTYVDPEEYWQGHYSQRNQIWSGNPNPVLVREVEALIPGTALDLGCGEGADAIWLARQGWRVTAVDISQQALDRGRAAAEAAEVGTQITWLQANLNASFPSGRFTLVSAQFLQSPVALEREHIMHSARDAVEVGGRLLVVGHAEFPSWAHHPQDDVELPSAAEVLESLELGAAEEWEVEVVANQSRPATTPDGTPAELIDSVVLVRRR